MLLLSVTVSQNVNFFLKG